MRTFALVALILALSAVPAPAQSAKQFAAQRTMMVETEIAGAGIKNAAVLAAMRNTPRHEFMPPDVRTYAYVDMALPIGERQTISPPFLVARMTQQLDVKPTDRVLEIGTGSGYQAAILSGLAKDVYTIEIVEMLAERAGKTFKRLNYKNVHSKQGDGYQGWSEHAPFDKIIVTCSPEKIPQPLVEQLQEGGRLVIPLGEQYQQVMYVMIKRDGKMVTESREPTFFVPMTGQADAQREAQGSGPLSPLVNGDFEQFLDANKLLGWYYVRQATIEAGGRPEGSARYLTFRNRIPGRNAQALQAIGVDGREVAELSVDLWLSGHEIQAGPSEQFGAKVAVNFFDENRAPVGLAAMGPWTGNIDWERRSAQLKVPSTARVAIVALGLLGATGELSVDQVKVEIGNPRTAAK